MADRMAAEIWIGGKLPRSLLDEFPIDDLRVDWDENPVDRTSEETLLAGREDDHLHFCDCEAAYGEFQELEGWLREHNIPFQRQSSGKYEYDPCVGVSPRSAGHTRQEHVDDPGRCPGNLP